MNGWYPQAIIFDMDGLLVDSEVIWLEAESALLEKRGKAYTPEIREQLVGLRMDEFFTKMRRLLHLSESVETLYDELMADMQRLIPVRIAPKPGAVELLDYARQRGLPSAIASSSPHTIIDAVVNSMGWGEILPVRVSADEVKRGKPAPDVYLETARRLHVKPADCLALEDSPNGARAAVAAGMVCYAVPDPSHTRIEAFDGITPYIVESLTTVLNALSAPR